MAGKNTSSSVQKSLEKIRPTWISRVGQEMARGMEVRADFEEQLERFFSLLEQSVTTGDPAWMDPILLDWAKSSTETELEEEPYHISFLINRMIALTIQVAPRIADEAAGPGPSGSRHSHLHLWSGSGGPL